MRGWETTPSGWGEATLGLGTTAPANKLTITNTGTVPMPYPMVTCTVPINATTTV